MTIKEIIDHLDELEKFDVEDPDNREALRAAIEKLRTHPDAQPNEPLTEAQLKEMDGKAVFVIPKCQVSGYMGIVATSEKSIICRGGFIPFSLCKEIYRRPPKEEHHEETP